jgi:TusA-related sulfurtransferase
MHGSSNYAVSSREIKEFLKFNGYTQTLQKMEQEERKIQFAIKEETKVSALNYNSADNF